MRKNLIAVALLSLIPAVIPAVAHAENRMHAMPPVNPTMHDQVIDNQSLEIWGMSAKDTANQTYFNTPVTGINTVLKPTVTVDHLGVQYIHAFQKWNLTVKGEQTHATYGGSATAGSGDGSYGSVGFTRSKDFNGGGIADVLSTNKLTYGLTLGFDTATRSMRGINYNGSGVGIGYRVNYRYNSFEAFSDRAAWSLNSDGDSMAAPYEMGVGFILPGISDQDWAEIQIAEIIPDVNVQDMHVSNGTRIELRGQHNRVLFSIGYVEGLKFSDTYGSYTALAGLGVPGIPFNPAKPWTSYQGGVYASGRYFFSRRNSVTATLYHQAITGSNTTYPAFPIVDSDRNTGVMFGYTHRF
ncbi:MAG: hypothetical protein KGI54_06560 [Pseudomonadota bacterium]|nr:hypothetical protein [Pseudomonadota bacterium]